MGPLVDEEMVQRRSSRKSAPPGRSSKPSKNPLDPAPESSEEMNASISSESDQDSESSIDEKLAESRGIPSGNRNKEDVKEVLVEYRSEGIEITTVLVDPARDNLCNVTLSATPHMGYDWASVSLNSPAGMAMVEKF